MEKKVIFKIFKHFRDYYAAYPRLARRATKHASFAIASPPVSLPLFCTIAIGDTSLDLRCSCQSMFKLSPLSFEQAGDF